MTKNQKSISIQIDEEGRVILPNGEILAKDEELDGLSDKAKGKINVGCINDQCKILNKC